MLLIHAASPESRAQDEKIPEACKYVLEGTFHYGFIIPHHEYMAHLTQGHINAYELSFSKKTNGEQNWHQSFLYPEVGFSMMYINLANPEQLGRGAAFYPYINFPLKTSEQLEWDLKFGYGAGIVTKPFDKDENYKNLAIGSQVNVAIHLNNRILYRWNENFRSGLGFSFTHFSNGAYKTPNLGLNMPSLNASLVYSFGPRFKCEIKPDTLNHEKFEINIVMNGGQKEITPVEGPKYGVFSLTVDGWKQLSHKSKFGAGIDIFYNSSLKPLLTRNDVAVNNDLEITRPGIHVGYGLDVGRLSCFLQAGAYLYSKYKGDGLLYHRMGTRYHITNNIIANFSLKTHFAKADFFELGIGYQFKK